MTQELLIKFAGYIIILLAGIVLSRTIFSIPAIIKYQKAQMVLLALMAQKAGVDADVIKKVVHDTGHEINIH